MIDWRTYRIREWDDEESFEYTKKEILSILKEQKVSISKVRGLFNDILIEIEDENPVNF